MQITVNDRQTMLDIAVIALGSVAGVFALAELNGLSITTSLTDGQQLTYELEDVVSSAVRSAYAMEHIAPATDITRADYMELLYATGTPRPVIVGPSAKDHDMLIVDKIDEVLNELANGQTPKPESKQQLTRIFQNPFDEIFS